MKALVLVPALLAATPVMADQVQNCWSQYITVEAVNFSREVIDGRRIVARVTSDAPFPISGIEVEFWLEADTRPLPIYFGHLRQLRSIDGALLPGESIETDDFHFMEERERQFARDASDFTIMFDVEHVFGVRGTRIACR